MCLGDHAYPSSLRLRPTCWLRCTLTLTARLQLSSPGRAVNHPSPPLLFPRGSAVTMNPRVELAARTFSCTRHHSVQTLTATSEGDVITKVLRGNDIGATSAMGRGSGVGGQIRQGALQRGWSCRIVLWEMPKDQLGWCEIFFLRRGWQELLRSGERAGDSL